MTTIEIRQDKSEAPDYERMSATVYLEAVEVRGDGWDGIFISGPIMDQLVRAWLYRKDVLSNAEFK